MYVYVHASVFRSRFAPDEKNPAPTFFVFFPPGFVAAREFILS
jgi:hypothetical protein